MSRYHPGTYKETHTPLYYAAINGHADAMTLLFELGADLVKYDEGADTVLRSIVRTAYCYDGHGFHTYVDTLSDMLENYRDANGNQWFALYGPYDDWIDDDRMLIWMWDPRHGDDSEGR
jgi:ankyrin repeat protein